MSMPSLDDAPNFRKWAEQTANPTECMSLICAHVASGGTVLELAKAWGVNFGHIMTWIRFNEERTQQYGKALIDREEWAKENILHEYRAIAHADIADAYNPDGTLKNIHDMPEGVRKRIASIEVDEIWEGSGEDRRQVGETKKVKFWDKTKALQDLGKNLSMFVDVRRHEAGKSLEELIMMSAKRDE